ncbi:MAG: hypothetical protein JSS43_17515 [Proteobacteria bacterium]|nr:hypothetical protein [Pseudomonadota bacterium]
MADVAGSARFPVGVDRVEAAAVVAALDAAFDLPVPPADAVRLSLFFDRLRAFLDSDGAYLILPLVREELVAAVALLSSLSDGSGVVSVTFLQRAPLYRLRRRIESVMSDG